MILLATCHLVLTTPGSRSDPVATCQLVLTTPMRCFGIWSVFQFMAAICIYACVISQQPNWGLLFEVDTVCEAVLLELCWGHSLLLATAVHRYAGGNCASILLVTLRAVWCGAVLDCWPPLPLRPRPAASAQAANPFSCAACLFLLQPRCGAAHFPAASHPKLSISPTHPLSLLLFLLPSRIDRLARALC